MGWFNGNAENVATTIKVCSLLVAFSLEDLDELAQLKILHLFQSRALHVRNAF